VTSHDGQQELTRRAILAAAGGLAFAAPGASGIRLGGPVFLTSDDPGELAREHRRLGYSAGLCPRAKADDSARINAIEKAFAAENVTIAEVGAWTNMLDPDSEKRKANMQYVVERLALADAVGARCCVNIAGTFTSGRGPHPDDLSQKFFDATVENCRRVVDEVKPKRAKFTIEMMAWCLPDSPDAYLKLLKAADRKSLGVHLDPCNGINSAARYYRNSEFISEFASWVPRSFPAMPRISICCPNRIFICRKWSRAAEKWITAPTCGSSLPWAATSR
jgi:Xylose isomerase-like TIM barrel